MRTASTEDLNGLTIELDIHNIGIAASPNVSSLDAMHLAAAETALHGLLFPRLRSLNSEELTDSLKRVKTLCHLKYLPFLKVIGETERT